MEETIRIRAVGDVKVVYRTSEGKMIQGRHFGRDKDNDDKPFPGGENVTVGPGNRNDLHRAIVVRKELELVTDKVQPST